MLGIRDTQKSLRISSEVLSIPRNYGLAFRCLSSVRRRKPFSLMANRPPQKQVQPHLLEAYDDYVPPFGTSDPLTILHFNDVYNVDAQNGVGGVSKFICALRHYASENPMILFSGDAFNPSILSTYTKGRHMVPFLNMMKIHTACYGNHDFDFGVDHLELLAGSCNFPWLLSNVLDAVTGNPVANGVRYRLCEWQGHKIGLIGLVEKAWIETLPHIQEDDLVFQDFVEAGQELCKILRQKGATMIIALTHMRSPNDLLLARSQPDDGTGIDLILGGHDHDWYGAVQVGSCVVAKSGCDFRDILKIRIYPGRKVVRESDTGLEICPQPTNKMDVDFIPRPVPLDREGKAKMPQAWVRGYCTMNNWLGGSVLRWKRVDVDSFPPVPAVEAHVAARLEDMSHFMDNVLGQSEQPLETRFRKVRTQSVNAGSWLCDLMRTHCKTDISVLNSGTIRSDCVIPAGAMKVRDVLSMLPMPDPLCVVKVSPEQLLAILENGVCKYPSLEGRFLQVGGLRFSFDPQMPPGQRIIKETVMVKPKGATEFVHYEQTPTSGPYPGFWTCTIKEFLREGKDGFDIFKTCQVLVEDEVALQTLVRNTFELAMLGSGVKKPGSNISQKQLQRLKQAEPGSLADTTGLAEEEEGVYVLRCQDDGRIVCVNPDPTLLD